MISVIKQAAVNKYPSIKRLEGNLQVSYIDGIIRVIESMNIKL